MEDSVAQLGQLNEIRHWHRTRIYALQDVSIVPSVYSFAIASIRRRLVAITLPRKPRTCLSSRGRAYSSNLSHRSVAALAYSRCCLRQCSCRGERGESAGAQ